MFRALIISIINRTITLQKKQAKEKNKQPLRDARFFDDDFTMDEIFRRFLNGVFI